MHPWHDIELGKKFPELLTAVIEIPKYSTIQYKLDARTGLIKLEDSLLTVARYPANYGFFPKTLEPDGDALDVFVLCREALVPLTLLEVRPIGGATIISSKKGSEEKIIAIYPGDVEFERIVTIDKLPKYYLDLFRQFFTDYKALEGDEKKVGKVYSKQKALSIIRDSTKEYQKLYLQGRGSRAA